MFGVPEHDQWACSETSLESNTASPKHLNYRPLVVIALLVIATYCNLYDQTARDCEYISIIIFKIFIVHEKSTSRSFHYDPGLPDATDSKRRRAKMRNQKQNQQQKFQETEQQEPWNWGSNSGSGKRKERKLLYRIPPPLPKKIFWDYMGFQKTSNWHITSFMDPSTQYTISQY